MIGSERFLATRLRCKAIQPCLEDIDAMQTANMHRTLFDKVWDQHVVATREDGQSLIWIDRHFVHEGSFHAFDKLRARQGQVARPDLTFGTADHYVPTRNRRTMAGVDPAVAAMVSQLEANCAANGVRLFGLSDPSQGIVHVVGPEQGLTLPGLTMVCGDSHTSTHGAFGAMAFGIGASDVAHVLLTQTLWQNKPRRMRIRVEGATAPGVSAKDIALSIIARIGADGARGTAIEYAGSAIRALSMEGRLTLCNLSIECGARLGMIAPDETTIAYLRGRAFGPDGEMFERACENWLALPSDPNAEFDSETVLDGAEIVPVVTWGTSPEDALPITATIPDPDHVPDEARAAHIREALDYMALSPGAPLQSVRIDRVFIGSCTNARIEDLRAAASVLAGRKARVPGLVSPGSSPVKRQAEAEGLDRIFTEAGLEWVDAGCSMCVGMNGDLVAPGERCASTTNRNFRGRQGPGSRTHLMSPAMVATAAVTGHLTDLRLFLKDGN
jgi:3-isopropylmalate/(R)-2-methylmalate dehydratase large subunit